MNGVSKIIVYEDITLITFHQVPNHPQTLSAIFQTLADAKINLDMAGHTAPQRGLIDLSFTLRSDQLVSTLNIANQFRKDLIGLKPMVSNGNCKIQLCGEQMHQTYGVAAAVVTAISKANAEFTFISTGEREISLLVPQSSCRSVVCALEETFQVKALQQAVLFPI